jgi:hypothetical protein
MKRNWGIFRGPNGCDVCEMLFVRVATDNEVEEALSGWIDTDGMGEGFISLDDDVETSCWPMTADQTPDMDAFDEIAEEAEEYDQEDD